MKKRARDLGIVIGRYPCGRHNAITDVAGVGVGHVTLVHGDGKLQPGKGPVRTGVTVISPCTHDIWHEKLAAGSFVLNGNGEACGLMWVQEAGVLESPIAFTNTLGVAAVQNGLVSWMLSRDARLGVDDDAPVP